MNDGERGWDKAAGMHAWPHATSSLSLRRHAHYVALSLDSSWYLDDWSNIYIEGLPPVPPTPLLEGGGVGGTVAFRIGNLPAFVVDLSSKHTRVWFHRTEAQDHCTAVSLFCCRTRTHQAKGQDRHRQIRLWNDQEGRVNMVGKVLWHALGFSITTFFAAPPHWKHGATAV